MFRQLFVLLCVMIAGEEVCHAQTLSDDRLIDECEESMARADHKRAEMLARKLLESGARTNSDRSNAFAKAYLGSFNVSRGKLKEGFQMLNNATDWAKEEKNDTVMAIALNGLGIYYVMAENNMVLALKYMNEAKAHADKAKTPMLRFRIECNVVQAAIIRNDTTMLDYAVGSFEAAEKLPVRPAMPIMARHIARLLILKEDFATALNYLNKADALGVVGDVDRISGELLRGEIYLRQKEYSKAYASYNKALGMTKGVTQEIEVYIGMARVRLSSGEYDKAKEYAAKFHSLAEEAGITAYDDYYYSIMMEACAALGQWRDAYDYSGKLNKSITEQADADKEYIQKQITTAMQVERKEQEAEMRRQELQAERRRNIILAVSLALVILLSVVLVLEIRKKNHLYKTIVRQFRDAITEGDNLRKQLRQQMTVTETAEATDELLPVMHMQPEEAATSDAPDMEDEDDGKELASSLDEQTAEQLWQTLMREIEENKVYLNQGLTRETLAKLVGTNRTYLSKIIYLHTGLGYTQFINSRRIEEAVRILSDTKRSDYPLKAICQDIGFSSMTTFYNLFKARTGMTPSVFRKNA